MWARRTYTDQPAIVTRITSAATTQTQPQATSGFWTLAKALAAYGEAHEAALCGIHEAHICQSNHRTSGGHVRAADYRVFAGFVGHSVADLKLDR